MDRLKKGLLVGASKLNLAISSLADIRVKFGWLIILAVVLQRIPFALSTPSSFVELKKGLLVLSYVLLLWALSRNFGFWSMRILALGTVVNFVAIVANGGLMPVSPEARLQAGMIALRPSSLGMVLPEGTGILLSVDQTNLQFLSDIIPISGVGVFSPGDVVIGVGLLIFFAEVARSASAHSRKSIESTVPVLRS